jgi:uncharacterized protein (TIGR02147 family)
LTYSLSAVKTKYVNLFEYADYRQFLADYQTKRLETDITFTKSEVCRRLGLPNTRSFFQDVLTRRDLSKTNVERFIAVLDFDEEEGQYFRVLVQFNQSVLEKDREILFDQLISLNRTPQKFVDPSAYAYYSKWYHSVVYAVLDVENFDGNYTRLAKIIFPPLTAGEAKKSIGLLKKLSLIEKNSNGFWKPTAHSLSVGSYVKSELVKQYQLQCLDIAKKAVLGKGELPKNISTMTFSINEEMYRKIEKKLQKFKSEVRSMVHKDCVPSDRVYSLNIQCLPQSLRVKNEN